MKKMSIILFLMFCSISKAQTDNFNFSLQKNKMIWQKFFNDSLDIQALKENLSLKLNEDLKGSSENNICKCKNGSFFMRYSFRFDFIIKKENDGYLVKVQNIIFNQYENIGIKHVSSDSKDTPIENYTLNEKRELRKNMIFKTNFRCLDAYFTNTFSQSP